MRKVEKLRLLADRAGSLIGVVVERGGVSEAQARAAIARGGAFLRGKRTRDPDAKVEAGDRIEIALREPEAAPPITVLHRDDRLIAVDKPAGVSAQEDLAGGPALPEILGALLVHRLDKGTTGVCVLARTRRMQATLLEEFRERRARKEYRALIAGAPDRDEGLIEEPVEKQPAATRWRLLERYDGAALIAAEPETGRTHQVRVHLRSIGLPLLGDTRYGGPAFLTRPDGARHDFARPMLHALSLEILDLKLLAPLPQDFRDAQAFLSRGR